MQRRGSPEPSSTEVTARVRGGVWQPRPHWMEGRSLLSLTGKGQEGAGQGCHRVTGWQRGQKAGPHGGSPGGRAFSMWAFGGNWAASARCAVGSEPSGKPAPVCFLRQEGWWPRPESEMGQNLSAGTSRVGDVQADLRPLLDLPTSCRGCMGSPSPHCTSCSGWEAGDPSKGSLQG